MAAFNKQSATGGFNNEDRSFIFENKTDMDLYMCIALDTSKSPLYVDPNGITENNANCSNADSSQHPVSSFPVAWLVKPVQKGARVNLKWKTQWSVITEDTVDNQCCSNAAISASYTLTSELKADSLRVDHNGNSYHFVTLHHDEDGEPHLDPYLNTKDQKTVDRCIQESTMDPKDDAGSYNNPRYVRVDCKAHCGQTTAKTSLVEIALCGQVCLKTKDVPLPSQAYFSLNADNYLIYFSKERSFVQGQPIQQDLQGTGCPVQIQKKPICYKLGEPCSKNSIVKPSANTTRNNNSGRNLPADLSSFDFCQEIHCCSECYNNNRQQNTRSN